MAAEWRGSACSWSGLSASAPAPSPSACCCCCCCWSLSHRLLLLLLMRGHTQHRCDHVLQRAGCRDRSAWTTRPHGGYCAALRCGGDATESRDLLCPGCSGRRVGRLQLARAPLQQEADDRCAGSTTPSRARTQGVEAEAEAEAVAVDDSQCAMAAGGEERRGEERILKQGKASIPVRAVSPCGRHRPAPLGHGPGYEPSRSEPIRSAGDVSASSALGPGSWRSAVQRSAACFVVKCAAVRLFASGRAG